MADILLLNDGSGQSFQAAEYALALAKNLKHNLLLANTVSINQPVKVSIAAGLDFVKVKDQSLLDRLNIINDSYDGFHPVIRNVNIAHLAENEIVSFINQQRLLLIVIASGQNHHGFNLQSIFNKTYCPLLILPANPLTKPIERITYLTDLRFCQIPVLNYLSKLACGECIHIAHLCAQGLPELDSQYAKEIFSKSVNPIVRGSSLYFNHIYEKDITKAVDVLIHGMHTDILVFQNRWFHFKQLFGDNIPLVLPGYIAVPVLIFPS